MANNTWQRLLLQSRRAVNKPTLAIIQNPLGIGGGVVSNAIKTVNSGEILDGTPLEGLSLAAGTLSYTKYWRYRLLFKGDNGMEKSQYDPRPAGVLAKIGLVPGKSPDLHDSDHLHTTRPDDLSYAEKVAVDVDKIRARRSSDSFIPAGRNYVAERFKALEAIPKGRLNDIFIINSSVSPYQAIKLQNRPESLEINPHGTWAAISSIGRNNPFMMYTGGEDTISFEVSWYASDPNHREEVISKCRLLESWGKADGYMAAPPVLQIQWGTSGLFDDQYFILESAPFKLTNFQDRAVRSMGSGDYYRRGIQDLHLYPNCATQQLTFKKVTTANDTHFDIVDLDKLVGILGIELSKTGI